MNGDNEDAIYLGSIPKHLNNPRWTSIRLYTPYKFCRDWNYERKKVKFRFLLACSLGEKIKFSFCFACALREGKILNLGLLIDLEKVEIKNFVFEAMEKMVDMASYITHV